MKLGVVVAVKKETIADQSVIELKKLKTIFDLRLYRRISFLLKKAGWINDHDILKKQD